MRSLVITWTERGLTFELLLVTDILEAGHALANAAYSYDADEVHTAASHWHEVTHPAREDWRCVLFGHTGDGNDSGYHICGRCSLHAYWDTPEGNPETTVNYDRAGLLLKPWWRFSGWAVRVWRVRPRRRDDGELPF